MHLGQMFLTGFTGCSLDEAPWLSTAIAEQHLGGVILFSRNVDGSIQNIVSSELLHSLTKDVQELAYTAFPGRPLFIGVDQEGGAVCRLKESDGFPASPSAARLGQGTPEATFTLASDMAFLLAEHGININFAPVVDLHSDDCPVIGQLGRSFGTDPEQVAAHARAFVAAHHAQGICCCLKHFPGHGHSLHDSHLGFVDITKTWQENDLRPYELLLQEGYSDGIMTAHVVHRGLDASGLPATLSPLLLDTLLRKRLRFNGVIFSDDLQMQAITQGWTLKQAVQKAVLAGVDILVIGNNLAPSTTAVETGIHAIQDLLDSGQVTQERIEHSLTRIAALKERIFLQQGRTCDVSNN